MPPPPRPPRSSEVDAVIERAAIVSERVRARSSAFEPAVHRARRALRRARRFGAIGVGGLLALVIALALWVGLVGPIGILGVPVLILAVLAILFAATAFSRERQVRAAAIAQAPLPQIAQRTATWIDQQRIALPPPAQTLVDQIGQRIASLQPQLTSLDDNAVEALELRRLVADELPQLVESYKRVPPHLRREDRNGRVAERELVEGMKLLDREIDDLSRAIASTDMDRLASHKRYLELRYKGDGEE